MSLRLTQAIISILFLAVVLAACGSGSAPAPAAVEPTTAAASAGPPVSEPAPATEQAMVERPTPITGSAGHEPTPTPGAEKVGESAQESPAETTVRTFRLVPEQSEAGYQVEEEFFNQPLQFFSPVGVTQEINGEFQLTVTGNQVELGDNRFTVDLRALASDDSRRDQRIREQWLESNRFPLAEFTATAIQDFPAGATEGQEVNFKLVGDMTIREITQPLTFDTTARLEGDTFTGTAVANLLMKDFGFDPPSILGMLKVTDGVTVTVRFTAEEIN
ncbi:MAG: YceI family protein [Chloroflexota bacterium]